ncbi:putative transferase CAF17 homolog, mitochondrial isoform X1 [Planococcus citri]|uniref:putative transferase CAF17 homolog, mitochondrial isoform X1 n=1 Tax=Planococcus citri TaxID=170843 RepID=UPI0031F874FE
MYKSLFHVRYGCRRYCQTTSFHIQQLHSRALIRLTGDDIYTFLQGLITNDTSTLNSDGHSIFTMFLNNRGRVLYDSLIYRKTERELILECDSTIRDNLVKHLKMYRVRKKVEVAPVDEDVWVVFKEADSIIDPFNSTSKIVDNFTVSHTPSSKRDRYESLLEKTSRCDQIATFIDPRIDVLGLRIYGSNVISTLADQGVNVTVSNDYIKLRYKFGVAEGVIELPPASCFPLEANCDYLNGVSFHKGCYLGQELTARTNYTGVVRKRLMPLILSSVPECELTQDSIVETEDWKKVGKLRGILGNCGLALLRITESLQNATKLKISNVPALTYKPYWWPQEQPVEKDSSAGSS